MERFLNAVVHAHVVNFLAVVFPSVAWFKVVVRENRHVAHNRHEICVIYRVNAVLIAVKNAKILFSPLESSCKRSSGDNRSVLWLLLCRVFCRHKNGFMCSYPVFLVGYGY